MGAKTKQLSPLVDRHTLHGHATIIQAPTLTEISQSTVFKNHSHIQITVLCSTRVNIAVKCLNIQIQGLRNQPIKIFLLNPSIITLPTPWFLRHMLQGVSNLNLDAGASHGYCLAVWWALIDLFSVTPWSAPSSRWLYSLLCYKKFSASRSLTSSTGRLSDDTPPILCSTCGLVWDRFQCQLP